MIDGPGIYIWQVLPIIFDIQKEHILEAVVESE
jgi:hypothetical protein